MARRATPTPAKAAADQAVGPAIAASETAPTSIEEPKEPGEAPGQKNTIPAEGGEGAPPEATEAGLVPISLQGTDLIPAAGSGSAHRKPAPWPLTGVIVRVFGPKNGRRRCGRVFGPQPVDIPLENLTEAECEALSEDKALKIEVIPVPD